MAVYSTQTNRRSSHLVMGLRRIIKKAAAKTLPRRTTAALDYQLSKGRRVAASVCFERVAAKAKRALIGQDLLFTSKTGVYLLRAEGLTRVVRGNTYGLTYREGRWYAATRVSQFHGNIISFKIVDGHCKELQVEIPIVDPEVHQIDFIENQLVMADTGQNCIRCFQLVQGRWVMVRTIYPNGKAWIGKKSNRYAHINSLFSDGELIYLVYHNQTSKTGRSSQLATFTRSWEMCDLSDLGAGCAHNILMWRGTTTFCDSIGGALVWGNRRIQVNQYTRGLAATESHVFVGGSDFAPRKQRRHSTGYIFVCDPRRGEVLESLEMQEVGGVYEVRILDAIDLGRSNCLAMRRNGKDSLLSLGSVES